MDTQIEYVFELPTTVIYELCDSLDPKNFWEDVGKFFSIDIFDNLCLARVMPGISSIDVEGCRQTLKPTEALLRIWVSVRVNL